MKKLIILLTLFFLGLGYAQIELIETHNLDYPVSRIVHYAQCADNPLFLCKKSNDEYIVVNDKVSFELGKNENLLYANNVDLYTSLYTETEIHIKKYHLSGKTYTMVKDLKLARTNNDLKYYIDIEMIEDHLFYFAYQPNTSAQTRNEKIEFYDTDLKKVFTVNEDLSIYNIHCFGADSVLILKEYVFDKKLTTHLYSHTGKLIKEENFNLEFKPSTQSTVGDYLKDDGIIFSLEQSDQSKTHVVKYNHAGKLLWDEVLVDHYYGFSEYNNQLLCYGGGNFKNPNYKILYIDETSGEISKEILLMDHYKDFLEHKNLKMEENSFLPFGLNVNPEHTWISFVISIYSTHGHSVDADRIMIFHGNDKVQYLDIDIDGSEHPKVVPTDGNHLIVGIGKQVKIYKVN